ncbi:MAG: flagellar protein FlaG [Candidatus Kapaibacteriota bacterium]|jgi:flagellar protein FlaG
MVNPINNVVTLDFTNLSDLKSQLDNFRQNVKDRKESYTAQEGAKQDKLNSKDTKKDLKISYDEIGQQLKDFLGVNNLTIEFALDDKSSRMIMKIIDNETKEVIKQFPPDLSLQIARIVSSSMIGKSFTDVTI